MIPQRKKTNNFSIAIISLIFLFYSCHSINNTTDNLVYIKCFNKEVEDSISNIRLDKNFNILPLETKPDCLIGEVRMIEKLDSLLFILDYSPNLFVFNTNGKFINQIGKIGDGPNEYVGINAFYLDKKNKRVVIIDEMKGALIHYDYYGKFIESERINSDLIKSCQQSIFTNDNKLLLNYRINFEENLAYQLVDLIKPNNSIASISYNPIKTEGYMYSFSSHAMSKTEDEIQFIMPLCDTIYNYKNEEIYPKYVIETPKKMAPKEAFNTSINNSFFSLIFKYGKNGFFTGFTSIFETADYLLLNYLENGMILGYCLIDKQQERGVYNLYSLNEKSANLPIFEIKGSDRNSFIGVSNAQYLHNIISNKENQPYFMDKYKDAIGNIGFDDNPVLFFYTPSN